MQKNRIGRSILKTTFYICIYFLPFLNRALNRLLFYEFGLRHHFHFYIRGFLCRPHRSCSCYSPQHSWGFSVLNQAQYIQMSSINQPTLIILRKNVGCTSLQTLVHFIFCQANATDTLHWLQKILSFL